MTNKRAMELLMIERACVRRASGMECMCGLSEDGCAQWAGYEKTEEECNRDCANCELVQDSKELLEMYDFVIRKMIEETEKEEEGKTIHLKDWQWNCDPRADLVI